MLIAVSHVHLCFVKSSMSESIAMLPQKSIISARVTNMPECQTTFMQACGNTSKSFRFSSDIWVCSSTAGCCTLRWWRCGSGRCEIRTRNGAFGNVTVLDLASHECSRSECGFRLEKRREILKTCSVVSSVEYISWVRPCLLSKMKL